MPFRFSSPITSFLTGFYSLQYKHLLPSNYSRNNFYKIANEARDLYEETSNHGVQIQDLVASGLVHPHWAEVITTIGNMIRQGLPEDFLNIRLLAEHMVPRRWNSSQQFELDSLLADQSTDKELQGFIESRIGCPHLECRRLRCSSSTLLHLFNLCHLTNRFSDLGGTYRSMNVLEWGGGYGNFARIFRWRFNPQRYTILDFAEMNAIQYVYLKLTNPDIKIEFSTESLQTSCQVSLFPIQAINKLDLNESYDLFISHMALSESGEQSVRLASQMDWFGAHLIHIIGQSSTNNMFGASADFIENALKENNKWEFVKEPYHIGDNYEIYASF
ncbi:MAG: putative sugar O-methyltransferase [Anaerolineaceae bacterium]|nr:putative sugar O-methyltransferase [Anaerolineaceae bacterium]